MHNLEPLVSLEPLEHLEILEHLEKTMNYKL
jgi:hypothetical protein